MYIKQSMKRKRDTSSFLLLYLVLCDVLLVFVSFFTGGMEIKDTATDADADKRALSNKKRRWAFFSE